MKNLKIYFTMGLMLALVAPSFAQGNVRLPKRFQRGDQYYLSSVKGLSSMMADIKIEDPLLYAKLAPQFEEMNAKQRRARHVFIPSLVVGGGLIIGGLATPLEDSDPNWGSNGPVYDDRFETSEIVALVGLGVMSVGTVIAALMLPNRGDIYNFVNLHNKNSNERKLDWQLGLNTSMDSGLGVKLALKF